MMVYISKKKETRCILTTNLTNFPTNYFNLVYLNLITFLIQQEFDVTKTILCIHCLCKFK